LPESPVPDRLTDWGLPGALSVKLIAAVRVPEAWGVNVTLIVQEAFTTTTLPHVVVSAKSLELVPVTEMLREVKFALPVLVRVIL